MFACALSADRWAPHRAAYGGRAPVQAAQNTPAADGSAFEAAQNGVRRTETAFRGERHTCRSREWRTTSHWGE